MTNTESDTSELPIDIMRIIEVVSAYNNVTLDQMRSKSKLGRIVKARKHYSYLARELTDLSLTAIGEQVKRNHATIIYHHKLMRAEIELYQSERNAIEIIRSVIIKQASERQLIVTTDKDKVDEIYNALIWTQGIKEVKRLK